MVQNYSLKKHWKQSTILIVAGFIVFLPLT